LSKLHTVEDAPGDELLTRAQREYLTGDWLETEALLQQILRTNDDDADARLMLATLYRRTGRIAEADECLNRLDRMEAAGKWALEIARERSLLTTGESQRNID
jgi:cytochrome c-type biogenesis protein CcmH/NrfG